MNKGDDMIYLGPNIDGLFYGESCGIMGTPNEKSVLVVKGMYIHYIALEHLITEGQMRMDTIADIINNIE